MGQSGIAVLLPGLVLAMCLSTAGLSAVQAAQNPYEAIVSVDDESDQSRIKGLRAALIVVLERVVGRSDAASSQVLANAGNLVQQYNFVRTPDSDKVKFRAVFDPNSVAAAVKRQGLPVFGVNPDLVEAWVVEVHGLQDADDFSRTYQHFAGISGIRRIEVSELRDSTVRIRMIVEGGVERAHGLALGGGLLSAHGEGEYVFNGR